MSKRKGLSPEEIEKALDEDSFDPDDPNFQSECESEAEDEQCIESNHDSESEATEGSDEDQVAGGSARHNYYYGKNRCFKWNKNPPPPSRTRIRNIVQGAPGPKGNAKNTDPNDVLALWKLFLTNDMLKVILDNTNVKVNEMRSRYKRPYSFTKELDMVELQAVIGLLYLAGVSKSGNEDVVGLFASDGTGRDIFRATMTLKRFLFVVTALRFDCAATRASRKETDKLAAIRDVWDAFVKNCTSCYTPGPYLTIDEMLAAFRGRCNFKMYMPKKPNKYGLKVMCMCDSQSSYLCNAFVYTGKDESRDPAMSVPTSSVMKLVRPVETTNRNVTVDNWFTSVELADSLRNHGLTILGTVKQNKRELPPEFKADRKRQVESSVFGHSPDMTLCSFVPKKGKAVILLSSMHFDQEVDPTSKKPRIILDYNGTKGGVDNLDKLCAGYTTSRRTRRWPMVLFHVILDVAGVNSMVILKALSPAAANLPRREYLLKLGRALIHDHLLRREIRYIPRELQVVVKKLRRTQQVEDEPAGAEESTSAATRARCGDCPSGKDRKTKYRCKVCRKSICLEHANFVCGNCV